MNKKEIPVDDWASKITRRINDISKLLIDAYKRLEEIEEKLKDKKMNEHPDSIKIKMLADAGFHPTDLQEKYLKLVEFVKSVRHMTCTICCFDCISCDALSLLRELGEAE